MTSDQVTSAPRRLNPDPLEDDELQRIFELRAEALSKRSDEETKVEGTEVFSFRAGAALLSVELKYVRNVLAPKHTALVPGTPAHMNEITHVNGRMVSMLRLDLFLKVEEAKQRPEKYLLLEHNGGRILVGANVLLGIEEMDLSTLSPAAQSQGSEVLKGITSNMALVLDGARVIQAPRIDIGHEE